jgi:hypothetical protein
MLRIHLSYPIIRIYPLIFCFIFLLTQNSCEKTYAPSMESIVINELLTVNLNIVPDQNGEYDDWIELFNHTSASKDISGYYLTDSKKNLLKWKFPEGTTIKGKGFLIIWADEDTTQKGLHSNFKLSSLGEKIFLSGPDLTVIDHVEYPAPTDQLSYSRVPDGSGSFVWQTPTFSSSNSHN